jgi:hypothetical protein
MKKRMSGTELAKRIILDATSHRQGPFHFTTEIKPKFKGKTLPMTFAIWGLVNDGRLRPLGRGMYRRIHI